MLFVASGMLLLATLVYAAYILPNLRAAESPRTSEVVSNSIIEFKQLSDGQIIGMSYNGTFFNHSDSDIISVSVKVTLINSSDMSAVAQFIATIENIKSNASKSFVSEIPMDYISYETAARVSAQEIKLLVMFGDITYEYGIIAPPSIGDYQNRPNLA